MPAQNSKNSIHIFEWDKIAGVYFITVTANADKTHVAGIEEVVDDSMPSVTVGGGLFACTIQ